MKGPDNVPISELASDADLAEVIKTVNKVIQAINSMWETNNDAPPQE
tara:strand:+ start:438 stop:578 length:141 start_codon:yes stop_codon:yes gene_type:complete